jgi:uncharacterized protein
MTRMKSQLLHAAAEKTWLLVLEPDDEPVSTLTAFAVQHGLSASYFTASGAFSMVRLGYFDRRRKDYRRIPLDEQVEVLSLVGDAALQEGTPKVHAYVVVAKADGTAHGGHLIEARVWPTLEVTLTESPAHPRRRTDPATGLVPIDSTVEAGATFDDAQARDEIGVRLQTVGLERAVRVSVTNGAVTLRGRVATEAEREAGENAAHATRGIRGLRNAIEVVPDPTSRD